MRVLMRALRKRGASEQVRDNGVGYRRIAMPLLGTDEPPPSNWSMPAGAAARCSSATTPPTGSRDDSAAWVLTQRNWHQYWDRCGPVGRSYRLGSGCGRRGAPAFSHLDAPLVLSSYSRLVIDCNRPLRNAESIAEQSGGVPVPGNRGLSP